MLTLVRPGFFRYFYSDLRAMFLEELDFVKEANYQTIYRRHARKDRLLWLRVPRVHHHISSESVLVTELMRGHPSADLIRAAETDDREALAGFAAEGIDPKVIARRLLEISAWSFFECPVFQGDPHPGNMILQPDNVIVMLDFGACGVSGTRQREVSVELQRRLIERDADAAAGVALAALEPLPYVDTDALRRGAERMFIERIIVLRTSDAAWWERTSAALWLAIMDATRAFQIPANQDLLRSTRATLLYDTIVARLDPTFDFPREFWGWIRRSEKRRRRRERAAALRRARTAPARLVRDLGRLPVALRRGLFWLGQATGELPRRVMSASNAGSFAASVLLRLSLVASLLVTAAAGLLLLHIGRPAAAESLYAAAGQALASPVVLGLLGLSAVWALGAIMARLSDRR
jgi:ubiquinone biosynthesis protein